MARFENIRRHLYPAIDVALQHGKVVTLEGFPCCTIGDGYERLHLTSEHREIKLLIRGQIVSDYDAFMRNNMSIFGQPCKECAVRVRCGGVYPEYIEYNGWGEFDARLVPVNIRS